MKLDRRNYMSSSQVVENEKCGRVLVLDVYTRKNRELNWLLGNECEIVRVTV